MALYPFIVSDGASEADSILAGVLLADRIAGDNYILLYDADGLYIEVYYSITKSEIVKLTFFKGTSFLEPYLEEISNKELDTLL